MLRVIGDVHGKVDWAIRGRSSYLDLVDGCSHSVQVGDLGDAEVYAVLVERVDPACHRFLPGNHDDYDHLPPHALGDFGLVALGGVEFFFVRGAPSIDKAYRIRQGVPWWPEEELDDDAFAAALEAYSAARPAIVITHDAPSSVQPFLAKPGGGRTAGWLERLLEAHRPRRWLFGHFHESWSRRIGGTLFQCLDELESIDLSASESSPPCDRSTTSSTT